MNTMFKVLSLAAILAVAAAPAAYATDVTNASLTQGPTPLVYYGSGNATTNHGFDVVTDGNVQLGLQAVVPQHGPITPSGNNYLYTPGVGVGAGVGLLPLNLANWDFVFSANTGGDTLSDYTFQITVTDVTTGQHGSFDPSMISDDGTANSAGVVCTHNALCAYNGADNGFQNAENLAFGNPLFKPNDADTYRIILTATSLAPGGSVVTDTINVVPTPEPSSLIFLGTGLLGGIGTMVRRRRMA